MGSEGAQTGAAASHGLTQPPLLPSLPAFAGKPAQRRLLLNLSATMTQQLLLLPPPLQHMLAPGCAELFTLAAGDSSGLGAAERQAALFWMLAHQQHAAAGGGSGRADSVVLPPDCPAWLEAEAFRLERSEGGASRGHVLLLGPLRQVQQAAAAELLLQLRKELEQEQLLASTARPAAGAAADAAGLTVDNLLPVADACQAAIQLLLLEQQRQQKQEQAISDAEEEDQEEEQQPPLLLANGAAVAEIGALATAVCAAGATSAAALAAEMDAAGDGGSSGNQGIRQEQEREEAEGSDNAYAAAQAAAGVLAVCNQLLNPADSLLQSGCLSAAAQHQLEAACEKLEGQLQAVDQLSRRLPLNHPLLAAVESAMEAAPGLWQPEAGDGEEDEEEGRDAGSGSSSEEEGAPPGRSGSKLRQDCCNGAAQKQKQRRRRQMGDVRNPAVRAMLAEEGGTGGQQGDASSWLLY